MNIMNKVTLKQLLHNKTRTIVTIIGVILSTSMITAVTTFISTLQQYAIDYTIADEGDWHGLLYNINPVTYEDLKKEDKIEKLALTKNAGYSMLEGSRNEFKPYLRVLELNEEAFEILPVHVTQGRLPENNREVVISEHVYTNGGVNFKLGDTLTLDLGYRVGEDGQIINPKDPLIMEDDRLTERLDTTLSNTYTIVGFCKRLSYNMEPYSDPAYTILTTFEGSITDTSKFVDAYIKVNKPKDIYNLVKGLADKNQLAYSYNYSLLRFLNSSNEDNFNSVLYSLAAILIGLIMVGSISLIYNSFAISVSERKKMFGLLSGAGATAKQRRNSVFFESFVIAGIGIPLGVIAGIGGIGTTLYLLRNQLLSIFGRDGNVSLKLHVSNLSIVVAILVALITIFISSYVPARRSSRVSALEAIRQTTDIKLSPRQVKTSKLTRKIFGIEGELALKNFKRNKRRYRTTVISLFISIVLFISASAFSMYLRDSVMNVYEDVDYDLVYSMYQSENEKLDESNITAAYQTILGLKGIEEGSYIKASYGWVPIEKEQVDQEYYEMMESTGYVNNGSNLTAQLTIYSVDHDTYSKYIDELRLDSKLIDNKETSGILIDQMHFYNPQEQRYNNKKLLKDSSLNKLSYYYMNENEEEITFDIKIISYADIAPFGIQPYTFQNGLILIIDENQRLEGFSEIKDRWFDSDLYFSAKNPMEAENQIKDILTTYEMQTYNLYNIAESIQDNRNIITIINVFSYGFIVLITLITIANVFNTISTNVNLRRREFAMLKSVGMTNQSFNRMLNYECIFYGLKALLYGMPVSALITYLIYQSIDIGVESRFYLPVSAFLISIFSVFLVVFASMMYSMSKIRKENILDALKNENL